MSEHRIIRVYGRVQGVFFRESTRKLAEKLGICGFARNNTDGTVTIEAEGSPAALDTLEQWCQQGPPAARVDKVEARRGEMQQYTQFEVRRG